jgi:PAT family beta-lactamase induction signal transducer AmpG
VLARKLAIVAGVYVIEGFPMGVFQKIMPVFLRREEVSLTAIGVLQIASLAWSAKVLWSPLVDRYGDRRQWISGSLLVMALCLALLTGGDPAVLGAVLWLAIAVYCIASATQDIAIDAYTIGLVDRGEEGPVNAVRMIAYRVGLITAGGGLLLLADRIGWEAMFAAGALISLAFGVSVRFSPEVPVPPAARRDTWGALRRWLDRPGVLATGFFILLYRVGDRAMGPMVEPFWVDRGFTNTEIALVSNSLGPLATLVGAVAGAVCVTRFGIRRSLWILGALALASNLAYAGAATLPDRSWSGVYAASLIESFTAGMVGVAFMSFLMRICEREHAAVQYALVTSIYAIAGTLVAVPSGWLTEQMGYAAYFALTALYALPAFAFLPRASRLVEAEPNGGLPEA